MGIQLNAVNSFCEEGFKRGKLIPISFEFPAFKITEEMFEETAKEIVSDKIRIGIETCQYGHPLIPNTSYEDLIEAQKAKEENNFTQLQEKQNIFSEQILPVQMRKDENLEYSELNKKILSELCDSRLKYSFANIEFNMGPYDSGFFKATIAKEKFVATMIMMKEMIPSSYRQMKLSLKNHPHQSLVEELNSMEEKPDIGIVKNIRDLDPKFAEEHFPILAKQLASKDKFIKASKVGF